MMSYKMSLKISQIHTINTKYRKHFLCLHVTLFWLQRGLRDQDLALVWWCFGTNILHRFPDHEIDWFIKVIRICSLQYPQFKARKRKSARKECVYKPGAKTSDYHCHKYRRFSFLSCIKTIRLKEKKMITRFIQRTQTPPHPRL